MKTWVRSHGVAIVFSMIGIWILVVGYLSWRAPYPGEESKESLKQSVGSAMEARDKNQFALMFVSDSLGESFVDSFFARLGKVNAVYAGSSVVLRDGESDLLVRFRFPDGAESCVAWPIVREEGRWLLDSSPSLFNACSAARST